MYKNNRAILFVLLLVVSGNAFSQTPYYPMPNADDKTTQPKETKKKYGTRGSEYGEPKQNIFKLNMLSPVYSTVMVFYQRNFQSNNSFQLGLGYMDFNTLPEFITPAGTSTGSTNAYENENTRAFFITPEYRYMIFGEQMNGVFVAPFVKYTNMQYTFTSKHYTNTSVAIETENKFTYQSLGLGILLGQQWVLRNKISIELFGGTVYNTLLDKKMSPFPGKISSSYYGGNTKSKWDEIETSEYISTANIRGYGLRAGFTIGFLF